MPWNHFTYGISESGRNPNAYYNYIANSDYVSSDFYRRKTEYNNQLAGVVDDDRRIFALSRRITSQTIGRSCQAIWTLHNVLVTGSWQGLTSLHVNTIISRFFAILFSMRCMYSQFMITFHLVDQAFSTRIIFLQTLNGFTTSILSGVRAMILGLASATETIKTTIQIAYGANETFMGCHSFL